MAPVDLLNVALLANAAVSNGNVRARVNSSKSRLIDRELTVVSSSTRLSNRELIFRRKSRSIRGLLSPNNLIRRAQTRSLLGSGIS